jgi:hypothetical protein
METPKTTEPQLDSDDVSRRRDEVVKRMLATPPQPRRQPIGKGQKKAKSDG